MILTDQGKKLYVVGITGRARSGKDSLSTELAEALTWHEDVGTYNDTDVAVASLATPLKEMVAALLQYSDPLMQYSDPPRLPTDVMIDNKEDDVFFGNSPRKMLQTLGTEWGRKYLGEDIWLDVLLHRESQLLDDSAFTDYGILIIPDIRFDNEADRCDTLIKIIRPDAAAVREHASEAGVSREPDVLVYNGGTLADLRKCAVINAVPHIASEMLKLREAKAA